MATTEVLALRNAYAMWTVGAIIPISDVNI